MTIRSHAAEAKTPAELAKYLAPKCQRGIGVTLASGSRRYTFHWINRAGVRRLGVRVRRRRLSRLPVVEALAAILLAEPAPPPECPECGRVFERHGKQRYCSPAHAARARKKRWLANVGREERLAARRRYERALRSRHILRNRAIERGRRQDAARHG